MSIVLASGIAGRSSQQHHSSTAIADPMLRQYALIVVRLSIEQTHRCGDEQHARSLMHSLKDGAAGLSTGLIYPPGVYADTAELIELSKVLSERQRNRKGMSGIYTTHMRSEGDALIESIQETLTIGREAKVRVHISHLKTSGERNWHKADEAIAIIEKARKKGLHITADRYPYTAGSTDLDTVMPEWSYEGGNKEEMKRIKSPVIRERMKKEILHAHPEKSYWNSIRISTVISRKNAWMEGKSIADIAALEGEEPVDMLFRILIGEKLRVGAIFLSMHEENLRKFLSLPCVMIGTDSSARSLPSDVEFLQGRADKAKRILGWEPTISFHQLIEDMVHYDLEKTLACKT